MSTSPPSERDEPLKRADIVLDRYRVEERLAAGGHSVVYRGIDERLERPVCIKAFHGLAQDQGIRATVLEHFVQEAFALSKLSHPNTLRIYDFGHLSDEDKGVGVPVQVSEYMGGGTLGAVVRADGPLSTREVLAIICKLGDALGEAHHHGIVHRDIKPQNILFTGGAAREPKLADFGIAKSALAGNVHNQANDTRVTAGFPLAMYSRSWAAPEQLNGEDASPAADIFSLGLVAIFSLTGEAICASGSTREGHEIRRHLVARIDAILGGRKVAPELIAVLQAACSFDESARPASAEAFVQALRAAHSGSLAQVVAAGQSANSGAPRTGATSLQLHPRSSPSAAAARGQDRDSELPAVRAEGTEATRRIELADPQSPPANGSAAGNVSLALQPRPSQRGPTIALSRWQPRQVVGNRECQFIELRESAVTLHIGRIHIQLSSTPNPLIPAGQSLTLKGITSFVAKAGGRPSRAVIISGDEYIDLVDPRKQLLGRIRVSFGALEGGIYYFQLGNNPVSVAASECPNPILIDSPTHHQSFLLYGVGQTTPGKVRQR